MEAPVPRSFSYEEERTHKRAYARAEVLQNDGHHQEAVLLLRDNLSLSTQVLGPDHPVTLSDQDSLSDCLHELGEFEQAVALDRKSLRVRKGLNAKGRNTLATQHSLADNLSHLGQYDEAVRLNRNTLTAREEVLGQSDDDTLETRHNLASNLHRCGQDKEASYLNRQVLEVRERKLNADHYDLVACRHNLAINLHALGELDNAWTLTHQTLAALRNSRPENDEQLNAVLGFQKWVQSDIHRAARAKEEQRATAQETLRLQAAETAKASMKAEDEKKQALIQRRIREQETLARERQKEKDRQRQIELDKEKQREIHRKRQEELDRKDQEELNRKEKEELGRRKRGNSERNRQEEVDGIAKAVSNDMRQEELNSEREKESERKRREELGEIRQEQLDNQRKKKQARGKKQEEVDRERDNRIDRAEAPGKGGMHIPGAFTPPLIIKDLSSDVEPLPIDTNIIEGGLNGTLSPPQTQARRHRANSSEDVTASTCGNIDLGAPTGQKPRSRSISSNSIRASYNSILRPKSCVQGLQNASQPEGRDIQSKARIYSNLCDSHDGGGNDVAAIQGANAWFEEFNTRTQALIAQSRKAFGARVKIAILDTGIDIAHPDINEVDTAHPEYGIPRARVKACKSFVDNEEGECDVSGHGTHSAALLLKLAPKANIYVARIVRDDNSWVNPEMVAEALTYATEVWKVDIITMSFGWPRYYPCIERAIDHASSKQVILFAAASNTGANKEVAFPANYSPVICVHSANGWGQPSGFTPHPLNVGPNFAVIGEAVNSTWPVRNGGPREKRRWGTSTSTPIAAAIAALVLEFVNQKPIKTSHDRRLKSHKGMTQIFLAMSVVKHNYRYVKPWQVLDASVGRTRVESRILDSLDQLFGQESSEQDG